MLKNSCSLQGDEVSDLQEQLESVQEQAEEQLRGDAELRAEVASLLASKAVLYHQVGLPTWRSECCADVCRA